MHSSAPDDEVYVPIGQGSQLELPVYAKSYNQRAVDLLWDQLHSYLVGILATLTARAGDRVVSHGIGALIARSA